MISIRSHARGYYISLVCDECKECCDAPGTVLVPGDTLYDFKIYCADCANYLCVAGVSLKALLQRHIDSL